MFDDMRHEIKVWQRWRAIKAIRTEKTITQNNFNIIQDNDTYYPQTEIAVGMISAIDRDDRHHEMNMRHLDEMQRITTQNYWADTSATSNNNMSELNPASGLPMSGGCDVAGNPYGTTFDSINNAFDNSNASFEVHYSDTNHY